MKKWKWWYLVPVAIAALVCISWLLIPFTYDSVRYLVKGLGQDPDAYTNESITAYGSVIGGIGVILAAFASFFTTTILMMQFVELKKQRQLTIQQHVESRFRLFQGTLVKMINDTIYHYGSYTCVGYDSYKECADNIVAMDLWEDEWYSWRSLGRSNPTERFLNNSNHREQLISRIRSNLLEANDIINAILYFHNRMLFFIKEEVLFEEMNQTLLYLLSSDFIKLYLFFILIKDDEVYYEGLSIMVRCNLLRKIDIHPKWKEFFIQECGIPAEAFEMPQM